MPSEINDAALDYLLARAGLSLTEAQKAELKTVYAGIAAMAERAAALGGECTAVNRPEGGFRVRAVLPWTPG